MATGWVTREHEFAAVGDLLLRADAGPAGLIVEGDPGIGKTTLWHQAVEHAAAQGFRIIAARGTPARVQAAHAAITDLLSDVDPAALDGLPPVQRAALDQVRRGLDGGAVSDERLVPAALVSVLRGLASHGPVLIALDDAHWLDSTSQAALGFATRRLAGRMAVLATIRTGEPSGEDGCSWLSLRQTDALHRIRMTPLSLRDVHAMILSRFGRSLPRPVISRIHDVADGNPFFAIELARSAIQDPDRATIDLPDDLATLVRRRIGDLTDEAAEVALAASCTVAPTVELIGRATSTSTSGVVHALETLESRGIVAIQGNRVRFSHPLFATGVYGDADATRRRAMHRSFAAVVDHPESKARHLALATTRADPVTVGALDAAAAHARGAPAAAAELLELAISLGADDATRLMQAADHHFHAGSFAQARTRLQTVLDRESSGTLRCMALMLFAALESYCDALPKAVEILTAAVAETDSPGVRLRGLLLLAPIDGITGNLANSLEHSRAAVVLAREIGVPMLHSHALSMWVITSFLCGRGVDDDALQTALAEEVPDTAPATYQATAVAAVIAGWTGDLVNACTAMTEVQQHLAERGNEIHMLWAASHVLTFAVWLGRYEDAERIASEAMERAEQMGSGHVMITALGVVAMVAAYVGPEDEARGAARAAVDTAHRNGSRYLAVAPAATLAFLELSLGNHAEALAAVEVQLAERDPALGTEIVTTSYLPDAIEALCGLGRVDEAESLVRELETNGARMDRPWMLAMGARGRALCQAARGDLAAATSSIEAALAAHDRLPMPFERARSQLLAGRLLRMQRRRPAAHAMLASAAAEFERLGTPRWIRLATAELDRLDSRPPASSLTAAERRVAECAGAGLSNRDIAAQLFLSQKTVEASLSKVYRKLGIRSRAALATRLGSIPHPGDG